MTLALVLLAGLPEPGQGGERPLVLCTTTDLAALVQAISGAYVRVDALIAFATCPGHVDLQPSQWRRVADADLVLVRGFEAMAPTLRRRALPERLEVVPVEGHWMVPAVHAQAADAVAAVLARAFPEHADAISARRDAYRSEIAQVDERLAVLRDQFQGVAVIADRMNAQWMQDAFGLTVVGRLERDEALSPNRFAELVHAGRERGAVLVIENRQSAGRAGVRLARTLEVPRTTLSNFPKWPTAARAPALDHLRFAAETLEAMLAVP